MQLPPTALKHDERRANGRLEGFNVLRSGALLFGFRPSWTNVSTTEQLVKLVKSLTSAGIKLSGEAAERSGRNLKLENVCGCESGGSSRVSIRC